MTISSAQFIFCLLFVQVQKYFVGCISFYNPKPTALFVPRQTKTPKPKLDKSIRRSITVAEAIIRPTGLIDPEIIIKPVENQVDSVLEEVRLRILKGHRTIITTLTKKFAEELDLYFKQINIKSAYIHSDVETLDRLDILADLRRGKYDVLIGINLLREGLDLPEVSLVAVFDADKEGFLRSRTSLIQIIGRAARHLEGKVIMYANVITRSMQEAINETNRRRQIQRDYNIANNITPVSTKRDLKTIADDVREEVKNDEDFGKAGARYTAKDGFVEIKDENLTDGFDIASRFQPDQNDSSKRRRKPAMQIYDTFNMEKTANIKALQKQELSDVELNEKLQKAIDGYNFEEAAAIRDILQKAQNK